MDSTKPRVLLLYYSYTHQTRRVAEAMGEVFQNRGCDVAFLPIDFVDDRYPLNFPLRPFWPRILRFVPLQLFGGSAKIEYEESALGQEYDLICIGSPTWWFYPALPLATFLKSEAAAELLGERPFAVFTVCRKFWGANYRSVKKWAGKAGGKFVDSAAFVFQGNQVQSMFSFLSYLQSGENRERYLGCKIYPFGVTEEGIAKAKSFAETLTEQLKTGSEAA